MDEVRAALLNALSTDEKQRDSSQKQLDEIRKHAGIIFQLPSLFSDSDPRVRKLSSVFFKNCIKNEWPLGTYFANKAVFIDNFLEVIQMCDKSTVIEIKQVLDFLFEHENVCEFNTLSANARKMIISNDEKQYASAILYFSRLVRSSKYIYDAEVFQVFVEPCAVDIINLMCSVLNTGKFLYVKEIVRILCEISDTHVVTFLADIGFYKQVFHIFVEVLKMQNYEMACRDYLLAGGDLNEQLIIVQSWIVEFFCRWYAKAKKKHCQEKDVAAFLNDPQNFSMLNNIVTGIFKAHIRSESSFSHPDVLSRNRDWLVRNCISFCNTVLENKSLRNFIMADPLFYITNVVLPLQTFNATDDENFDSDPAKFVRERYSYYANDARSYAVIFFADLIKKLRKQSALLTDIFAHFKGLMYAHHTQPSTKTAFLKYAVLYLLSTVVEHFKTAMDTFLGDMLLPELVSPFLFLRSQACFCLQYLDSKSLSAEICAKALEAVLANTRSDHEIVRTDALICIPFFFDNQAVQDRLRVVLPDIVSCLISIQHSVELDAIGDTLEAVISNYPDIMSITGPSVVQSLCSLIVLPNVDDEKIIIYQGYFRIIMSLLIHTSDCSRKTSNGASNTSSHSLNNALSNNFTQINENLEDDDNQPDWNTQAVMDRPTDFLALKINYITSEALLKQRSLVRLYYPIYYPILHAIFQHRISDMYDEALQLIGETIFAVKEIDKNTENLFYMIMSIPKDDKQLLAHEMYFCLENFFSYSRKDTLMNVSQLSMTFIEQMCILQDEIIEETDDFSIGMLMMQTIIVHLNSAAIPAIPEFSKLLHTVYDQIDRDSAMFLHFLEAKILMFFANPHIDLTFIVNLVEDLCDYRHMFTRVYDLGLLLIFTLFIMANFISQFYAIGLVTEQDVHFAEFLHLISTNSNATLNIDQKSTRKLSLIFIHTLENLPLSVLRKNNLLNNKEIEEPDECVIEEEVYEETFIDHVNFRKLISDSLKNLSQHGQAVMQALSAPQIEYVKKFL